MQLPGLIVKKVGMTRMVDEKGQMIAVTLLQADDQKVTKILTPERDGYHGVQVGYYTKPEFRLNKPDVHRLRKAKVEDNYARFREFRLDQANEEYQLGTPFNVESFSEVKSVDVTGVTKGRGFQGTVRRYNTKTGRRTHGSHFHRRPGSLGQCTTPGRVYKNKNMPGHMGVTNNTVQNLRIMDVDSDSRLIAIKGSVPGNRHGYLVLRPSVKIKADKKA